MEVKAKVEVKGLYVLLALFFTLASLCSCAREGGGRITSAPERGEASQIPYSRVHFEFDRDDVLLGDVAYIDKNAEWMNRNKGAVIILEGHCDEIGPTEYNMELGDRRARSVKAHLVEKGISYNRVIMVVSYGDTKPLDPSHSREAWKMNRRVEFILR